MIILDYYLIYNIYLKYSIFLMNFGFSISLPYNSNDHNNLNNLNKSNNSNNLNKSSNFSKDINLINKLSKKFNSIQIMFSKLNLTKNDINQIKSITSNFKYIYVHSNYQINMGLDLIPTQSELYNSSIEIFMNEYNYAKMIGSNGIVLHMGKNVGKKYLTEQVKNNMVKFIIEIFKQIELKYSKFPLEILLETPAGQGGEMCWDLNEFVNFITKFKKLKFYKKLNVCVDTCHIFQAGYDLNNPIVIKSIHKILFPIKKKIKLIHLNDSVNKVGLHIDRHEQIGKGFIQIDKLAIFILDYKQIPMILETSYPYQQQINKLVKYI